MRPCPRALTASSSPPPGAKLEAAMRGIINEAYLDDLAKKTHRGLEGQFLRGFHAGGHLFGYAPTRDQNESERSATT
jgi:hypothetical protein